LRKKTKKDKRRILILFTFSCFIASYFCLILINFWTKISANKKVEYQLAEKYNSLLENESTLQSEIVKLEDSDYVARYAREKYLYSKEGEIIFKIIK